MLTLHAGNRLELLAAQLIDAEVALDPLEQRIVVTESVSLGRWITHRFCQRQGIACLIETPLPAACLWQLARGVLELPAGEDPLSRERMHWWIHAALGEAAAGNSLPELAGYLRGDGSGLRRWQLAGRIADCFDRYQYYRPELIRRWSDGRGKSWQARLWRAISAGVDDHRVALMERFLGRLRRGPSPRGLPRRLDLFSVHGLPRLLLEAYAALARHTEVHFWLLAPTPEYWADLASPREMARKRLEAPREAALWQAGNPLLTQWGRQGQVFQDMLLSLEEGAVATGTDSFAEPGRDTLLGCLQSDIYQATDAAVETGARAPERSSIEFHVCHGPMRECQVLRDRLLHCLREDDSLQPEDILVMVPEIGRYAPCIEAVFSRPPDDGSPWLPFNLSDVVQPDEHPLIRAFLDLLALPDSRFARSDVLGLVTLPEVQGRFGLTPDDSAELDELFAELRVYWGLDGRDKRDRFDLPAIHDNTWRQAFERIMAGFALGDCSDPGDPAPQPGMTAARADRAARLFTLLDALRRWMRELASPATPGHWAARLAALVEDFFVAGGAEDRLELINETIGSLQEDADLAPGLTISLPVVRHWLTERLGTCADRGRFYSGGVTFCGMKPLRGVPFRVIALLGMQEQAFPRRRRAVEFDRMASDWRHGDPDPVQEDRYLFLETLLAARERLLVSYTGLDIRSNDEREPSVLVRELQDHLDERHRGDGTGKLSETLTRRHPLQPFGLDNYRGPEPGFDKRWLEMGRVVAGHHRPRRERGWPVLALSAPPAPGPLLDRGELARFFRNPPRRFVQQRLRLYDPRVEELPEDEPFELDGLQRWQLAEDLLAWSLRGETGTAEARFRARGMLPHGALAGPAFEAVEADAGRVVGSLPPGPLAPEPVDVDLPLTVGGETWRVAGRVRHFYPGHGLIHLSASAFRIANLLPLWIDHLALAAGGAPCQALYACRDRKVWLQEIGMEKAKEMLAGLVELYLAGQRQPLCLPPKTASAWFESWRRHKDAGKALHAAGSKWHGGHWHAGERDEFHFRVLLRGSDWQPDETLEEAAMRVFGPLQENIRKEEEVE